MTHIAIQEQLDGKAVDWMEKVCFYSPLQAWVLKNSTQQKIRTNPGTENAQAIQESRLLGILTRCNFDGFMTTGFSTATGQSTHRAIHWGFGACGRLFGS
jgi:hypothetical protein